MLTPGQIAQRENKLTASRVACLMKDDEAALLNLWRELVGDPAFVPDDLSGVWPVQLGTVTEALNIEWFSRKHGPVSRMGDVVTHECGWAAATLDAWSDQRRCPVECKHVGGREPLETIIDRYMPQMTWQMIVTASSECALSVIMGANEPIVEFIPFNEDYARMLWERASDFMQCVWSLTPPVALPAQAAPLRPERICDMRGSNSWAAAAAAWLEHRAAKKLADTAEKELKALVPADAIKCHGHGVVIQRDRANRMSLKEHRA